MESIFPQGLLKEPTLPTPWLQTSDFQNCDTVHSVGLSLQACGYLLQQIQKTNAEGMKNNKDWKGDKKYWEAEILK